MHQRIKDTNCTSTTSEEIIKRKCDGESECIINVNNKELGEDPCPGTYKYLEVNFICYQIAKHAQKQVNCAYSFCVICAIFKY